MMTTSDRIPPAPLRLSAQAMYDALLRRDSDYEGRFIAAIKTTGIFCRPTCAARKPRPENVEYFAGPIEARHAGYRACRRCRPEEDVAAVRGVPAWVEELKHEVEDRPERRITGRDLRARGLDPSTVRRAFLSHYGVSFQAFARSRRVGVALAAVREGSKLARASVSAGYSSESGLREAINRLLGSAPGSRGGTARPGVVAARWIETPIGAMLALADDRGLRVLDFVDRRGLERHVVRTRARLGVVIAGQDHPHLDAIASELGSYFRGQSTLGFGRAAPPVPLAPAVGGTAFQQSVWAQLRTIPPGRTRTYAQQAAAIGRPTAVRAVARANGENILGLIVPCHRVIGSDGSMTGYGGGVWRKRWLLEHERKHFSA